MITKRILLLIVSCFLMFGTDSWCQQEAANDKVKVVRAIKDVPDGKVITSSDIVETQVYFNQIPRDYATVEESP
jgi:hypothetical protein